MENDEVVIDLRVLMWEVLRKWHIILISCIVFAVAFAAFGMYRNRKNSIDATEVPVEDLYDALEPGAAAKVENVLDVQERIIEKSEYGQNSVYMSLNAYNVDMARVDFILSDNPGNKYIRQMYYSYIFNGGLFNKIAEEYTGDIEACYINELIRYMSNYNEANIYEDSEKNYAAGNSLNNIISVKIYGKDKEQCEELKSLTEKNVKLYEKEVQEKYKNHSIDIITSNVYKAVDTDISSAKSTYDSQIISLYNEYQTLYNALDENQVALYNALLNEEETEKETEENGGEEKPAGAVAEPGISLKYVIAGILFGGFILVAGIVLVTMFNGKVFVGRQITDRGLSRVFGTYGKNKNGIAGRILGDVGTENPGQMDIIVAKVNVHCKKNGIGSITIIDNCVTSTGSAKMKLVSSAIEKSGIKCNKVTLSEGDQKYTELCNKDILIIEELGKGTLKELEYMFTQLRDLESEVCGVICVQ